MKTILFLFLAALSVAFAQKVPDPIAIVAPTQIPSPTEVGATIQGTVITGCSNQYPVLTFTVQPFDPSVTVPQPKLAPVAVPGWSYCFTAVVPYPASSIQFVIVGALQEAFFRTVPPSAR